MFSPKLTMEDADAQSIPYKIGICHRIDNHFKKGLEMISEYRKSQVFQGNLMTRRFIWLLFLFFSIIGCLYTVGDNLKRYIINPTVTTVAVERADLTGLPFPSVTICSLNAYENSDIAQIAEFLFNPDLAYDINLINKSQTCDKVLSNVTEDIRNATIWEVIQKSFPNIIYYCGFIQGTNSELQHCEKELQPVLTSLGVCYTFNSITSNKTNHYVTSVGAKYGLKMIFNLSETNHPSSEENLGIKIVVHERNDIARPNLYGFGIPWGENAYIGITKKINVDYTSNVECINDRELSFYPQYKYSQFACEQNAFVDHIAQPNICNCILDSLSRPSSGPYGNTPNCTFNDTCCLLKEYSSFDSQVVCHVPCHFEYYDYHISYSRFSTSPFFKDLARSLNMSKDNIRDNFMSVSVFFEDLHVTTTTTFYSYSPAAFLSDLGGALSLFLGVNLIVFIDFVMFILFPAKCLKKCKKNCYNTKCLQKCKKNGYNQLSEDDTPKGKSDKSESGKEKFGKKSEDKLNKGESDDDKMKSEEKLP